MTDKVITIFKYLFSIALGLLIIYIMFILYKPLFKTLAPFIIATVISYLLSPFVDYLEHYKIKRLYSILIVYIIAMIVIFLVIKLIIPVLYSNITDFIEKVPYLTEKFNLIANEISIRLESSNLPAQFKDKLDKYAGTGISAISKIFDGFIGMSKKLLSNILYIILIPLISFYLLKDKDFIKDRIFSIIPRKYRDEVILVWYQIDLVLKRFIAGEFFVAVIICISTSLALSLLGVKFSLLLGIIAGITNVIPYAGPIIGIIPPILVALVESPWLALKVAIIFIVIQQIESGIISPKIVGESVGMHPVTIIFIIILFEHLFGVVGMFIAVPVSSIIMVIFKRIMINRTQ